MSLSKSSRTSIWLVLVVGAVALASCRQNATAPQPEATPTTVALVATEPAATAVPPTEAPPTATPIVEPTAALLTPTPEPTAEASAWSLMPGVTAYNLGDAIVTQERFPEESRFRNMPVRLEGIIAVPDDLDHPAPVVVVLHGNHPGCPVVQMEFGSLDAWPCAPEDEQPNYLGFDYLVRALADRGYVAFAPNINAEYTLGFGEPEPAERLEQLLRQHLAALATATDGGQNDFGVELTGRANMGQLALVGHSQGGEFANRMTRLEGWDSPYSLADNGFGPVDGLLLIAPSFNNLESDGTNVPLAVILPQCDGDVMGLDGQFFYETVRQTPEHAAWATTSLVEGANHNFFNRYLGPDAMGVVNCPAPLAPTDQQAFLVDYTAAFLDALWATQPDQLDALAQLGLNVDQPVLDEMFGVPVTTVSAVPEHLSLLSASSADAVDEQIASGSLRFEAMTGLFCPAGFDTDQDPEIFQACRRQVMHQPGQPAQLLLSWTGRDGQLHLALPEDQRDISRFSSLSLRAVIDPLSELNAPGQSQSFTVELTDGSGNAASVVVPNDAPALRFPTGEALEADFAAGDRWSQNVHMSDIRLPLASFAGVDLSDITDVTLAFDQTDSGSIFVADVQLVRPSAAIGANSTLLANANGVNDPLQAIGRLNGAATCTATLIDTGGSADSPAYVISNGHCAQPWDANGVFRDLPGEGMTVTFNYFADTVEQALEVPVRIVAYSTMKGRDIALLELQSTLGELAAQGVRPLSLASELPAYPFTMRAVGAPVSGVPQPLAYLREETCLATAAANLFEFYWHFDDAIRNNCQDIYGGSSGSPVFAGDDPAILALINTTTVGGHTPCAAGTPCEASASGVNMLADTSYTTPVIGIDHCFSDGMFDLAHDGCPLDDGRQLTLSGYPAQPIQPTLTGTDGQTRAASWNTTLSGDLPYYRFKIGPAGLTDCRSEDGYGPVIALGNQQRIDDPLPPEEGSTVLCVVAGDTPEVGPTWQQVQWATVARAEIDTTPPTIEPYVNIIFLGDTISFEPIFSVPELSDFILKVGPEDSTSCAAEDGYGRYRRIPLQASVDDLPLKVCVVGFDMAGNRGEPMEHVVPAR